MKRSYSRRRGVLCIFLFLLSVNYTLPPAPPGHRKAKEVVEEREEGGILSKIYSFLIKKKEGRSLLYSS